MNAKSSSLSSFLVPAAIGLAVGALVVYSIANVAPKWTAFIILVLGSLSVGVLVATTTNLLRKVLLFGAVLTLPIHYSNTFMYVKDAPFIVMANGFPITLSNAFLIPLLLYWVYELLFDPECPPVSLPSGWLLPMTVLFLINLVSAFLAPVPFYSVSMIWLQLKCYLILLYFANNVRDQQTLKLIGIAFAGILIMEGVIVLEQRFVGVIFTAENLGRAAVVLKSRLGTGDILRMAGTESHPNNLAMYLNLMLPWVGFLFIAEKKASLRILFLIAIVLAMMALILSGSRGAWMGLAITSTAGIFLWMRKQGRNPLLGLGVSGLLMLLLFSFLFLASGTFRGRLVEGDAGAAYSRVPLMQVARDMISSNPVLGVGLNNYTHEMVRYDHTAERIASNFGYAVHNTWLLMSAETGVPSFLVFAYLFFYLFLRDGYRVFQNSQGTAATVGIGVFCLLLAWSVHNMVNLTAPYDESTLWVFGGLLAAVSRATSRAPLSQVRTRRLQAKIHA